MAQVGWIDLSKSQRDKIVAVLDLLRPEGRIDELGTGVVRDALADRLFPGISTIHTRAKYFYIIPNILRQYASLSDAQKAKRPLGQFLEQKEKEIMWRLAEEYNHEENHGVIGITKKRGESLARYPSTIYWRALATFNFIRFRNYSLGAYQNHFSRPVSQNDLGFQPAGDDDPSDDKANTYRNNMGIFAPYDPAYETSITLDLDASQAQDLSDRILRYAKDSLLAELIRNELLYTLFFDIQYHGRQAFMVFAPLAISHIENRELRRHVTMGHDFSLAMYGANITYNQLIQQHFQDRDPFAAEWRSWVERMAHGFLAPDELTIDFVSYLAPTMRDSTYDFLDKWFTLIKGGNLDVPERFELVENQEYNNKRNKARLRHKQFDDCKKDAWIGFDYLDYRYNNAKTILNDITQGLHVTP